MGGGAGGVVLFCPGWRPGAGGGGGDRPYWQWPKSACVRGHRSDKWWRRQVVGARPVGRRRRADSCKPAATLNFLSVYSRTYRSVCAEARA